MKMSGEVLLAYSTFPDVETARRIASQLVSESLAACANILSSIESIYRWQGKIEEANETLALFKTTSTTYPAFQARLKSLHPYEVPEIICVSVVNGLPAYLDWVNQNTTVPKTPT